MVLGAMVGRWEGKRGRERRDRRGREQTERQGRPWNSRPGTKRWVSREMLPLMLYINNKKQEASFPESQSTVLF